MNKLDAIAACKTFRRDADELLQRMKDHTRQLTEQVGRFTDRTGQEFVDAREVVAQHIISTRDLESCIMRQGMTLKYIGQPDPYPQSKNPESTVVEPTSDGLKL